MYYLSAILLSFIIGLIRRGSLRSIIEHPYKKWFLGFVGLVILIILNYSFLITDVIEPYASYLPIVNFVGYLLLLLMFIFNLDDIFSILIALGLTFDFIETFINGGLMPVSQTVIDNMPQNLPLTQSIINATSVTYTTIQPETLLSFLGVILPIPVLTRFVVMAGTIPGLSIGKTFIITGLLGLVQAAMKLPVEKKEKIMEPVEEPQVNSQPTPQAATAGAGISRDTGHFDSLTEELFFEDNPLPKDPLDKIFSGDIESQQTKHIDRINELKKTKAKTEDLDDLDREVEMLTKPLGTGIINSKEIREHIIRGEQDEIKDEIDGFFSQEFKDKQLKTEEIFTEEEPTMVTQPEGIIGPEGTGTKVFTAEETEPIAEIKVEETEPVVEKETKVEEVEPVQEIELETQEEETVIEEPVILLSPPEEASETEPVVNISPDIFMTLDQYNEFIDSIDDKNFIQEFKYYLSQFRGEPVEDVKLPEKPEVIITPAPEPVSELTAPIEIIPEEVEPVIEATQTEEVKPEISEPEREEVKEATVKPRRRKRKKVGLIPEQKEIVHLKILPETEEKEIQEEKVIIKVKQEESSMVEDKEKVSELSSNEPNSDKIEVQETQPEEVVEEVETTKEETTGESQQVSDKLSDIVFDKEEVPEILTDDINLDLLEELIEPDHYVSSKRGSFIQDEGSGYYVNKAYKEEKANMDKSEEEMLNVWAQVSQENQKRKMSRRRQSMGGFNSYSPFAQEKTEEIKEEAHPEQFKVEEKAAPQKSVNTMTDEERRAAGYEYVSIDVNGKTLSFWQKRN